MGLIWLLRSVAAETLHTQAWLSGSAVGQWGGRWCVLSFHVKHMPVPVCAKVTWFAL